MKKILSLLVVFILSFSISNAEELNTDQLSSLVADTQSLTIEKQLVGIVGAISGTVRTETRELKSGDQIYLNETIIAGAGSGTQILLLDQSTFTIGSESEVIMDTFIYDPSTHKEKL